MKQVYHYFLLFLVTAGILITSFTAVARIPRAAIQKNVEKSAVLFTQKEGAFPSTLAGLYSSGMDYYADAVLLDIAWYLEPEHPLESISWAKFYTENRYNYNGFVKNYFIESIKNNLPANQQYLRYWHGSIIFVKPMLMFLDINGIHVVHGLALAVLTIWLMVLLRRKGLWTEGIILLGSMIAVSIWFVPFCMEFVWMFLCMLIASIITVSWTLADQEHRLPALFLIVGMVSVFVDFFTTETLTIAVPLLFVLRIRRRKGRMAGTFKLIGESCILWGVGYVGMWILKWGFAAACLHRNVFPFVRDSIWEHVQSFNQMGMLEMKLKTIANNFSLLFPLEYELIGQILILVFIVIFIVLPVVTNRIRLRSHIVWKWILLYLLVGIIPIIRFLVVSNHSLVHSFFTHRALAAFVMAVGLILLELVEMNPVRNISKKAEPSNESI